MLIAPVVAERLTRSLGARKAITSRRERAVIGAVCGLVTAIACGVAVSKSATMEPLSEAAPIAIARHIAAQPGQHRVLNDYNASGVLAYFGGPDTRLAIDGRADRYGGAYIDRYLRALEGSPGWRLLLDEIQPTHAVLASNRGLTDILSRIGWRRVMSDDSYVLLEPPRTVPSP